MWSSLFGVVFVAMLFDEFLRCALIGRLYDPFDDGALCENNCFSGDSAGDLFGITDFYLTGCNNIDVFAKPRC